MMMMYTNYIIIGVCPGMIFGLCRIRASFVGLTDLRTLNLAFNDIADGPDQLEAVLRHVPNLIEL